MAYVAALATLVVGGVLTSASVAAEPPREEDYFGTVISVEPDVLVISAEGTILEIPITEDTEVRLPLKRDASLSDLSKGDLVAISLEELDGVLVAEKIFLIPSKTRVRHVPGVVASVSDTSITIQPPEGAGPITFSRTATTTVSFHKGTTELAVGAFVIVVAARDETTGELESTAIEIHVTEGQAPADPAVSPEESAEPPPLNTVEIQGVFKGVNPENNLWIIGENEVEVTVQTRIEDAIAVGQLVEVSAELRPDDTLLALEIEPKEDEDSSVVERVKIDGLFEGVAEDGKWIVSGTAVEVGPDTDTDGLPEIGQRVKVKGIRQEDGTVVAREIENKRGSRQQDQEQKVELEGTFDGLDENGNWLINGTPVAVGPGTRMKGEPAVGSRVEVEAIALEDGSLLATNVEGVDRNEPGTKREAKIRGILEEVLEDGSLVIDGRTVTVSVLTEFENDPVVGNFVKVEAFFGEDGVLIAREVESKGAREVEDEAPEDSDVEIEGIIDLVNDDGSIVVNGITVVFGALSKVKGDLTVGSSVEIEGVLQPDGTLLAGEVKGEGRRSTSSGTEVKIEGPIEQIDLDLEGNVVSIVVEGLAIAVEPLTRVEGTLEVDVIAEVKAIIIDGVYVAGKIDVQESGQDRERQEEEDEGDGENRDRDETSEVKIEGEITDLDVATTTGEVVGITVAGAEVRIDGATRIQGDLAVGAVVEIKGTLLDGVIVAAKIEVEGPEEEEPEGSDFELQGTLDSIDRDVDEGDRGAGRGRRSDSRGPTYEHKGKPGAGCLRRGQGGSDRRRSCRYRGQSHKDRRGRTG